MFTGLGWMLKAGLYGKMTGLAAIGTAKAVGPGALLATGIAGTLLLPAAIITVPMIILGGAAGSGILKALKK